MLEAEHCNALVPGITEGWEILERVAPRKLVQQIFSIKTFKEQHKLALKELRHVPQTPENIANWIAEQE